MSKLCSKSSIGGLFNLVSVIISFNSSKNYLVVLILIMSLFNPINGNSILASPYLIFGLTFFLGLKLRLSFLNNKTAKQLQEICDRLDWDFKVLSDDLKNIAYGLLTYSAIFFITNF